MSVIKREIRILSSRPVYVMGLVVIPVALALFFIALLSPGLPLQVPAGIVDMDNTPMSREISRDLSATELVDFTRSYTSFNEAMDGVQRGEVMGFFIIPENFEREAVAGRGPALSFYSNLTYYVPGSLVFKGFKTMSVTTSGKIVRTGLTDKGISSELAGVALQPLALDIHPLGNPWISYAYYLGPSFIIGCIGLMAIIMTIFSLTQEIKRGTSPQLYAAAGNRLGVAILGKLLPQTAILFIVALFCHSLMFHWNHYPMYGSEWNMLLGLFLFVVACQSFGVIVVSVMPNPRLALSIGSLVSILTFSIAAFSFPVEAMYGAIGIFSYILPVRYYFLIYLDQALNGIPLYFSRFWYIGLLCFPVVAVLLSPLNRRWMRHPVYVP